MLLQKGVREAAALGQLLAQLSGDALAFGLGCFVRCLRLALGARELAFVVAAGGVPAEDAAGREDGRRAEQAFDHCAAPSLGGSTVTAWVVTKRSAALTTAIVKAMTAYTFTGT